MIDLELKNGDWILAKRNRETLIAYVPECILVEVYDKGFYGLSDKEDTVWGPLSDIWENYDVVTAFRPGNYTAFADMQTFMTLIRKGTRQFSEARTFISRLSGTILYKGHTEDKRTIREVEALLKEKGFMDKGDTLVLVKE